MEKKMTDWRNNIVIQKVDAIAVYTNEAGEIVIRQEGELGEEDSLILFPVSYADVFVKAVLDAAKQIKANPESKNSTD